MGTRDSQKPLIESDEDFYAALSLLLFAVVFVLYGCFILEGLPS